MGEEVFLIIRKLLVNLFQLKLTTIRIEEEEWTLKRRKPDIYKQTSIIVFMYTDLSVPTVILKQISLLTLLPNKESLCSFMITLIQRKPDNFNGCFF